jgi:hypothetical protein
MRILAIAAFLSLGLTAGASANCVGHEQTASNDSTVAQNSQGAPMTKIKRTQQQGS